MRQRRPSGWTSADQGLLAPTAPHALAVRKWAPHRTMTWAVSRPHAERPSLDRPSPQEWRPTHECADAGRLSTAR